MADAHLDGLAARGDHLNEAAQRARYTGPGTDLTIGLPAGHVWVSGHTISRSGITFTANLPTEEVFTIPHKDRVDGTVRSTKPLSYGGTLIEDFSVRFEDGRVAVAANGGSGAAAARRNRSRRRATRRDRARSAQLALSQSGRLFYNTLFDENAATHVALGAAYEFTLQAATG